MSWTLILLTVLNWHKHSYSWQFLTVMNICIFDVYKRQRSIFLTFLSIVKNFGSLDAGFNDGFKIVKNSDSWQFKNVKRACFCSSVRLLRHLFPVAHFSIYFSFFLFSLLLHHYTNHLNDNNVAENDNFEFIILTPM